MTPSPSSIPSGDSTSGVHSGLASSGSAGGGPGFGSSLGASLVVHGAVVATLALSLRPWAAPSDARRGQNVSAHLAAYEPLPEPEPPEELEPVEPLEPNAVLPVEEFDLPAETVEDAFPEAPAPAPAPGTSLLETVVYPRIAPIPSSREVAVESPAEAEVTEVLPPEPVESTPKPVESTPKPVESTPGPEASESSPEPVAGACPPPAYPRVAERRGWTGTVVLLIEVAADGTVTDATVESSSGRGILDEAALRAVRAWRFTPAVRHGLPTAATVRKPIRFGER